MDNYCLNKMLASGKFELQADSVTTPMVELNIR